MNEQDTRQWFTEMVRLAYIGTEEDRARLPDSMVKYVSKAELDARIDELGTVQLEHGPYLTQTFVNGQAMTIMERLADLQNQRNALDKREDL